MANAAVRMVTGSRTGKVGYIYKVQCQLDCHNQLTAQSEAHSNLFVAFTYLLHLLVMNITSSRP